MENFNTNKKQIMKNYFYEKIDSLKKSLDLDSVEKELKFQSDNQAYQYADYFLSCMEALYKEYQNVILEDANKGFPSIDMFNEKQKGNE